MLSYSTFFQVLSGDMWSPTDKARVPDITLERGTSRPKVGAFILGQRPWLSAAGVTDFYVLIIYVSKVGYELF